MKKYKIINVEGNCFRLKDIKEDLSPSILVASNKCVLVPYKDKHVFVLKKDLAIRRKIKKLAIDFLTSIIMLGIILFILFSWLSSEPEGYYRYKDGRADGTGIYYEWHEGGEE